MLAKLLLVGSGGFIGSALRYGINSLVLYKFPSVSFPLATTSVNLLGCLLVGALAGLVYHQQALTLNSQLFLITGLLGGFTTMSAFGFESFVLLERKQLISWLLFASLHIFACIALVWIGWRLVAKLM